MSSLQDQLLKAGLVEGKKAKQIAKDKRKSDKVQKKSNQPIVDENKELAQKAREEKVARDRELNALRKAEADRKAIAAQIRQLIDTNKQSKGQGDIAYNFTDGKHIKKILVSAKVQEHLTRGQLAIVKLGDNYELVPSAIAAKINERDESWVLSMNAPQQIADDDDPYAGYEIPDDLMW